MRVHRPTAVLLVAALLAVAAIPWLLTAPDAAIFTTLAVAFVWCVIPLQRIRRAAPPLICLECSRCHVPFDVTERRVRCMECGLEMSFGRFITFARRAIDARALRMPRRVMLVYAASTALPIVLTTTSVLRPGPLWSPAVSITTLPAIMLLAAAAQTWLTRPAPPDCAHIERQWRSEHRR